ncbi:MAG: large-conductance mechanosensitive channel protein MscL [Ignavibacteriaceae bacterium]|jgi:large conductance mechanosensitive channel|nr:large-conductance mechanosensitive channel protein MscL [Ignavibacteriaceae bacterium]
MKGDILKQFKAFAMRGNVVDLAVGIIIGGAFGKIVSSIVSDIIMPPIGILLGGLDFKDLAITLKEKTAETAAVQINYGAFINTVIDFLIIAWAIFMLVKLLDAMKKKEEAAPAPPAPSPVPPSEDVLLLREIRDLLKSK